MANSLLPLLSLFGVLRPIPVKTFGYNPLSPVYEERMIDVIRETSNFDSVLIAGTAINALRRIDQFLLKDWKPTMAI